jgi:hypothetical protein
VKKGFVLLAVLGAALLGLELAVRAAGYSAPFLYRPDPQLGWTLRHDRGYRLDKPDETFRIAVLGDEHSEARQFEPRDTWWWLLGHELEGCSLAGGKRVEVLNFGVASYGTAQELALLESVAVRYRPDLVLLQFTPHNDPQNNSFALATDKERPFYRLDAKGVPRIDESFNTSPGFLRHAAPWREVARQVGNRSRAVQWLSMLPEPKHRPGVQKALLGPPPNELWDEAWKITEALIVRIDEVSRRNGAKFAMVAVNEGYGAQRIAALAAQQRLAYVALDLKVAGQRAAAELIASSLCGSRERRLRTE